MSVFAKSCDCFHAKPMIIWRSGDHCEFGCLEWCCFRDAEPIQWTRRCWDGGSRWAKVMLSIKAALVPVEVCYSLYSYLPLWVEKIQSLVGGRFGDTSWCHIWSSEQGCFLGDLGTPREKIFASHPVGRVWLSHKVSHFRSFHPRHRQVVIPGIDGRCHQTPCGALPMANGQRSCAEVWRKGVGNAPGACLKWNSMHLGCCWGGGWKWNWNDDCWNWTTTEPVWFIMGKFVFFWNGIWTWEQSNFSDRPVL